MDGITYEGAFKHSWIDMAYCPDLHVNSAIVIVCVHVDCEKNGIGHVEICKKPTTNSRPTTSPVEQTP